MRLNKEQAISLARKWEQDNQDMTYLKFRRTVSPAIGFDCAMVLWSGVWLGIELDGYAHS